MAKIKSYDELKFTDDFLFGKIMEDSSLCRQVLECILQTPVGELEDVVPQREFRNTMDGKPIRLDIYTRDSETVYDVEMQNLNGRTLESRMLPLRSRFYQSAIDADLLNKTDSYMELAESIIVFICTFDPFDKNYYMYSFSERCNEDVDFVLPSKTGKFFFNAAYTGEDIPGDIKELYEFIRTGNATGKLTRNLEIAVQAAKGNEQWRSQYMKERLIYQDYKMEGREEGFEEGIAIGREEGLSIGREEGMSIGREEGLSIGREEGLSIGREEGIAIGIKMAEDQAQARIKELEEQVEFLKAEKSSI